MSIRRTIGKLAKEVGVGVETVRFYERKGLIEQPPSGDGFRHYGDETLAAVKYIKIAQRMGLSLGEIAKLRGKMQEGPGFCAAVRETARRRLEGIAGEIAALRKLESELTAFLQRCGSRSSDAPCPILIELGALDAVVQPKPRQRGSRP